MSNVKLIHEPSGRECEVPAESADVYLKLDGWKKQSPKAKTTTEK